MDPDTLDEQLPSAEKLEPIEEASERARRVPGVVADEGLYAAPLREMFGLWRLSARKRKARNREKQLAAL